MFNPGNFDPSKMNPEELKKMLALFENMSDEQIKNTTKMMGINIEPQVLRGFINTMKNASDEDLNKLKEQYKNGNVKMDDFNKKKYSEYNKDIDEAKKLREENKFIESIEKCQQAIDKLKLEKVEEADKEEYNKQLGNLYEQLTLSRYTSQDYDQTIKDCQKAIEELPKFSIYNRLGTCFFKKGKHIKARDAYLKAKELFPQDNDPIAEKYLKMALEEIENY